MSTLKEIQELISIFDKALELPAKGTHIGDGIHVDMPTHWDGKGEVPLGWTATAFTISEETLAELKIDEKLAAKVKRSENQSKLTEEEKVKLSILNEVKK